MKARSMLEQVSRLPGHSEEVLLHRKRGPFHNQPGVQPPKNYHWLKAPKQMGLVHAQKASTQHHPCIQLLHVQGCKNQGKIDRER